MPRKRSLPLVGAVRTSSAPYSAGSSGMWRLKESWRAFCIRCLARSRKRLRDRLLGRAVLVSLALSRATHRSVSRPKKGSTPWHQRLRLRQRG